MGAARFSHLRRVDLLVARAAVEVADRVVLGAGGLRLHWATLSRHFAQAVKVEIPVAFGEQAFVPDLEQLEVSRLDFLQELPALLVALLLEFRLLLDQSCVFCLQFLDLLAQLLLQRIVNHFELRVLRSETRHQTRKDVGSLLVIAVACLPQESLVVLVINGLKFDVDLSGASGIRQAVRPVSQTHLRPGKVAAARPSRVLAPRECSACAEQTGGGALGFDVDSASPAWRCQQVVWL